MLQQEVGYIIYTYQKADTTIAPQFNSTPSYIINTRLIQDYAENWETILLL